MKIADSTVAAPLHEVWRACTTLDEFVGWHTASPDARRTSAAVVTSPPPWPRASLRLRAHHRAAGRLGEAIDIAASSR